MKAEGKDAELTLSNAAQRGIILEQLARLRVNSDVIKHAFALGTVCIICTEMEQLQHSDKTVLKSSPVQDFECESSHVWGALQLRAA